MSKDSGVSLNVFCFDQFLFSLCKLIQTLKKNISSQPHANFLISVYPCFIPLPNPSFQLKLSLKNRIKYLPYLILSFSTLHFSYGLGYLKGIWYFVVSPLCPNCYCFFLNLWLEYFTKLKTQTVKPLRSVYKKE